uniref:Transposase Tc1-like domain-containing protein n=1 Tax=Myripristis murdjan TaxID=586833 RepID=A0A667ZR51_9TELE
MAEHMKARLEFAKKHLQDSWTVINKILWSDETKRHVWRKPGITHHLPNTISRKGGKLNGAQYRDILNETWSASGPDRALT